MTVTTTKRQDYLGRWLTNATPGTSAAKDHLGRNVIASNKDFIGRLLLFSDPSAWTTAHAYTLNGYVKLSTGEILQCTTAGTSGGSEPSPPAVGASVTDGGAHWLRIH